MNTSPTTKPTIIQREALLVLGTLTQITLGTESGEKFAAIWQGFEAFRERIKSQSTDQKYYGVSFAPADDGCFDYLAGMTTTPGQTVPERLVVRKIPAATYAVFSCPVAEIGQTYGYIFGEWRAKSGYQVDTAAPAFEQYPPLEGPVSPVLIHIPIREKPAL
jgi:predicted transcriptional regulator YdeE